MDNIGIKNPRRDIEKAIATGDLTALLKMCGVLHGHYCPFSALGVKAAARAVKDLGVKSTGMEEVVAVVETNSCFSDGIQIITGCTFGNNALIYRDLGKTAFTLARRSGEGVRVSVKADRSFIEQRAPEAAQLFQKVVINRQGTPADQANLKKLWAEVSFLMLDTADDDVFNISRVKITVPAYARIFASVKCSVCGENIMEPRARLKDGAPVCLGCSGQDYYQLAGDGISVITT